jgi:ferredoxin
MEITAQEEINEDLRKKKIVVNRNCPQTHACPLPDWCESITQQIEASESTTLYHIPDIDHDTCERCGICVKNCKFSALELV